MIQLQALNNLKSLLVLTHLYSLALLPHTRPSALQKFSDTSRLDLTFHLLNRLPLRKQLLNLRTFTPFPSARSSIFLAPTTNSIYLKGQHLIQKFANNIYPLLRQLISQKHWTSCLRPEYVNLLMPKMSNVYHPSLWQPRLTPPVG